jgi:hypothetical protein
VELLTETSKGERKKQPPVVTIGCDLGQRHDPTAICVTEAQLRETGRRRVVATHEDGSVTERPEVAAFHVVRQLERRPLGTSYPEVARRLARLVDGLERELGATPALVLDATGVGLPVVDIVREELRENRCTVTAAFLTGTERMEGSVGGYELHLGKRFLVSNMQALIQQRLIDLPDTGEARELSEELLNFELRLSDNANLVSGAFRTGTHDDLAIALGLSCLEDPRSRQVGLSSFALWE